MPRRKLNFIFDGQIHRPTTKWHLHEYHFIENVNRGQIDFKFKCSIFHLGYRTRFTKQEINKRSVIAIRYKVITNKTSIYKTDSFENYKKLKLRQHFRVAPVLIRYKTERLF